MERQEAVECFTREAEPVLEEGKKLFYRELQEKTEQLSAVICDAIHEIRLETVRLEKEKMMVFGKGGPKKCSSPENFWFTAVPAFVRFCPSTSVRTM